MHLQVLATGPAVFFLVLLTTATCSTALRDASPRHLRARGASYSKSVYSEFTPGSRPYHLGSFVDREYSQIRPSRDTLKKQTALLWEQTNASNNKSREELRKVRCHLRQSSYKMMSSLFLSALSI